MKFFNSSKKWRFASSSITKYILAALLSLVGVQGVLAQYYVAGDGTADNGWACGENWNPSGCEMSQSGNVYVYDSPELAAGTYLFRITNGSSNTTWGWSEVYSSRCTAIVADDGSTDHDVKITLNESSKVKIIFNPNAAAGQKITVYAGITPLYIRGDVNGWGDPSNWQGVSTDGINYTWKGTLLPTGNEGKTNLGGAFKIATAVYANVSGNDTWYWDDNFDFGGEGSGTTIQISDTGITTATLKAKTETGGNGNLSLSGNLQYHGAVYATMITFNISTKELVIYTKQIEPTADSYVVEWAEPVYDSAAGTVTVSATVSTAENAGFTLADATFEAQVNVEGLASSPRTKLNQNNNSISHTIQGVQAGSTVNYSLQIVTGGDSKIVLPSDVQKINPQTYTVPESVQPGTVSLYLIGSGTSAQWVLANALPFTYENGVYTWTGDLTVNNEAFKILTSNKEWEPAYVAETSQFEVVLGKTIVLHYREKTGDTYTWGDNKFKITEGGEYTIKVTLGADNSGSMIVTKKSDPAYSATITADASASQQTARQVTLTSLLTEAAAGTDLTSATCQFQYLSADAAEGTEYSNLDASVAYNADGTSLTTTALPQGGKYLFRAVWTLNGEVVATSEPSEATCVYPVTPNSNMFAVQWEFATDPADLDVTITANIGVAEGSCLTMEQISKAPLECEIFVNEVSYRPQQTELVGDVMKATLTVTGFNASDKLNYRIVLVTGAANTSVVLAQGNMQIPGDTYVVEAPELHNSTVYFRGDENGWAYDVIDDKYIGKTYDDVNVFWDWSDNPIEFESVGDNAGSKFKFDDTSDGSWGNDQWNNGDSDAWIGEVQISDNKAAFTAVYGSSESGNYWLLPEICPAKISRIDLNTETNQIVITFADYNRPAKDIWFRSEIVEGGWGDGISDPIASGVNPKYQGQTKDGITYEWDWSGSKAVTLESGTGFKFGEYTGNASWGNAGYGGASDSDKKLQSSSFGQTLNIVQASGNEFIPQEKITITGITLNIQDMTVVFTGEAYVDRYPVTVNTVNGEAGGTVTTEPADIGNMAIGETVTVTATANEGYVALFEATSGCVMTDGDADNIKVFEVTAANPVITVTFQVLCQTVEPRFTISGQFNADFENDAVQYAGTAISSENADPKDGIWSDGARFIQLTANSVPANYFEWVCTGYAIDGVDQETVPEIAWTGQYKTSARAELSLPGTYTFVCNAKCNLGDDWTQSDTLTITAPVPAMGFDGVGIVGSSWDHTSAGREGEGLMTRQNGSLVWKSRSLKVNGFTDADEFVIIQQYKRYGCTPNNGWNGWNECQAVIGNDWGNKINGSNLNFSYVKWRNDAKGSNFLPVNAGSWVAGADGTDLQLVVTMTGYDSYTVKLAEYKNIIATATTEPADGSRGSVSMAAPDGTIIPSGSNVADYVGQQVTLTATPAQGYKVASWEINGKVTESDRTTIKPKLSGDGLKVVVTFERDCYAGVAYDLTGGGVICAEGGKTELSLNTLMNVTYQLYKDGKAYGNPVQGDGEAAKWTISETGTYTAKAYDSRHEECQEQAIDMNGSAVVTSVTAPKITVNPGANVHLTVLQARSFTADVPVDWSITDAKGEGDGVNYCEGDGYMISSQTDTSLVAKFLCIGTAKITATMKFPNKNCKAEVTVYQNGAETEVCAPEDVQ